MFFFSTWPLKKKKRKRDSRNFNPQKVSQVTTKI